MTTSLRHERPLRGTSSWGRCAWMLLRVEMRKARDLVAQGDQWAAKTHVLEARALAIHARRFDRHHGRGRAAC